ncbi:MAG: hypothetical protein WCD53_23310 [Microcoleus sp.]
MDNKENALYRQWTYSFADRIVVQTKRAGNYFSSKLQKRICVISNPVLLPPNDFLLSDILKNLINQ